MKGIYSVRIQFSGRRELFSTEQSSKRAAAKVAVQIYHSLQAVGWDETLEKYKKKRVASEGGLTVGEYIREVEEWTNIKPKTMTTYKRKFRKIVSDIAGVHLPDGFSKFDYVNGGNELWLEKVDSVKLSRLTPEAINKWLRNFVREAEQNPLAQTNAKNSANSSIRNSKALFSKAVLSKLGHLELPSPLPFEEVKLEKSSIPKYQSEINAESLLIMAQEELAHASPDDQVVTFRGKALDHDTDHVIGIAESKAESKQEAFKILILALCVGLRRDEIDKLRWNNILWDTSAIRIEISEVFSPKSGSTGDIPIDAEIVSLLETWQSENGGDYVIKGVDPRPAASYAHYRADRHQKTLVSWLREKGITAKNPIHSLRKEFGSLICERAGIYIASRLLRHSDIRVTAKHYTDDRGVVTSGLGSVLAKPSTGNLNL